MKRIVLVALLWLFLSAGTPAYADDLCAATIDTAAVRAEVDNLHPELLRAEVLMFANQYDCEHGGLAYAIRQRNQWSEEYMSAPPDSPQYALIQRIYRGWSERVEKMTTAIIDACAAEPP